MEKKSNVHLLNTESTGALGHGLILMLRALARYAALPEGHDSTMYGMGSASPSSFYRHHLAAISSALIFADILAIRNHIAADDDDLRKRRSLPGGGVHLKSLTFLGGGVRPPQERSDFSGGGGRPWV